ncbi:hypothetical protein ABZ814_22675 [Micromonospora musae]|uniref:hypothetical protein n=1 Tax=Micromonospora musae TaxID=1894970 RepID=UPI0033F90E49
MAIRVIEVRLYCDRCETRYEGEDGEQFSSAGVRNGAEDAGWQVATRSTNRKDLCPACRPDPR